MLSGGFGKRKTEAMYYGRYSRETKRWTKSWPLPSEIVAHAKIDPAFERSSGLVPVDSGEAVEDAPLNKVAAE